MLHEIIKVFLPYQYVTDVRPFGSGHINSTYKVELKGEDSCYILQKINTDVFKDPKNIAEAHFKLQNAVFNTTQSLTIAKLIPTATRLKLHTDTEGGIWRMTSFISNSYSIDVVTEDWQAFEAGNAFGWFAKNCNKLNPKEFKESIKDFHRLSFRLSELKQAIANDKVGRISAIKDVVKFYEDREEELNEIEKLVDEEKIPLRVVHNDTKINNLLFRYKKAAAVIDLDTVGPGILYYDYGDALRTVANTAEEDEIDLSKVHFNFDAFTAFTNGYMGQVKTIITDVEEKLFYQAPILMTYLMGIRFLSDYLNGDTYYKTIYANHNLARSLVQKTLIESMENNKEEMKEIISQAINKIPVH